MTCDNWQWTLSFHTSDNRQITYSCLFPDRQPDGGFSLGAVRGLDDVPQEARRALAERVRLDPNAFADWAQWQGARNTADGVEVFISIRRCWLNTGEWHWTPDGVRQEYRIYKSYPGGALTGPLFRKLTGSDFTLNDIAPAGRRRLAETVDLDEREIDAWCEVDKVEATTDSFLIYVAIPLVWLNAPRRDDWEWREAGYNADQSLAYYTCRGLAVSRDLINTVANGIEASGLVPPSARDALAREVGLDASEWEHWAQEFCYTASENGLQVWVGVPNVWICADLLQGGSWWDVGVVNWGGTFGQVVSSLGTWKKKEVFCYSIQELKDSLRNYRGTIWGMVLYAHGGPWGNINPSQGDDNIYQGELISLVAAQKFKLASLYLMQCYSGYKGILTDSWTGLDEYIKKLKEYEYEAYLLCKTKSDFLEKYKNHIVNYYQILFRECHDYEISISTSAEIVTLQIKINWDMEWSHYVVNGPEISYRGWNALAIDWWPIEELFEELF